MKRPSTSSPAASTAAEALLAATVTGLCAAVLLYRVSYSGSWDGDPGVHARAAMEAVNVFAAAWQGDGNLPSAFLQCFLTVPKMLHEALLAGFVLLVSGVRQISYADIEFFGAWFSTVFACGGAVLLYLAARLLAPRPAALVATAITVLSGYFLLYANFPRHNMPSHFFAWLSWLAFLYWRSSRPALRAHQGFLIGLVYGLALPIHYTAAYVVLAVLLGECALLWPDRSAWRATVRAYLLMLLGALLVPALIDAYFYYATSLDPTARDWRGLAIGDSKRSFAGGMLFILGRIAEKKMAFKLAAHDYLFFFRFMWHNLGPVGSIMMLLGTVTAAATVTASDAPPVARRRRVLALAALLAGILLSLQFFQNARKLAVFYPAWAALAALGLAACGNAVARRRDGRGAVSVTAVASLLLLAQLVTYGPTAREVWHARRDAGYMREYLADRGVTRVLALPIWVSSSVAPGQVDATQMSTGTPLSIDDSALLEFAMLERLVLAAHKKPLMDCVRQHEPVVRFPNQVSLDLWQFEFPLTKRYLDADDPLTRHRALYRWPPLLEDCGAHFVERGFLSATP